jgi:signal peptidase II
MSERFAPRVRNISRTFYVLIAAVVFFGDQLSKEIVEDSVPRHAVVRVIPGFFNLTHTVNTGVAFSLFSESPSGWKTALLIGISVALLIAVVLIVGRSRELHWQSGVGLALVVGGALSNLTDRLRFGSVVDFLDFYIRSYHWPTFNLADSAIVVGAGFLILHVMFSE